MHVKCFASYWTNVSILNFLNGIRSWSIIYNLKSRRHIHYHMSKPRKFIMPMNDGQGLKLCVCDMDYCNLTTYRIRRVSLILPKSFFVYIMDGFLNLFHALLFWSDETVKKSLPKNEKTFVSDRESPWTRNKLPLC